MLVCVDDFVVVVLLSFGRLGLFVSCGLELFFVFLGEGNGIKGFGDDLFLMLFCFYWLILFKNL